MRKLKQEAQLSQRGRGMLHVIEYFARSLEMKLLVFRCNYFSILYRF